MSEYKSGFIGIVGPTNSGKSTLLNALLGAKISIVSPKVQTTYHAVRGVLSETNSQMIFTDTPGFQRHKDPVARLLNRVAEKNAKECDLILWVFDASRKDVLVQIERYKEKIQKTFPKEKSFVALNKVDKVNRLNLLPIIEAVHKMDLFSEIIPISALKKDGLLNIKKVLNERMQEGAKFFPDEEVTDRPKFFLVAEMVREKIYQATHEEVPYAAWVEVESWEEDQKVPMIHATIHVDSDSKKGILIGKGADKLKRIGTSARRDIEAMTGKKVCLKLRVDVQKDWKRDPRHLQSYLELDKV